MPPVTRAGIVFGGAVAAALLAVPSVAGAQFEMNGVSGTVTNADGVPLEGVCVESYGGAPLSNTDRTDSEGRYVIDNLYGGGKAIGFGTCGGLDGGLVDEWYDNKATRASADPVEVPAEDSPVITGIDAELAPPSSIAGTVTDDQGLPLPRPVCVVAEQGAGTRTRTETDATGAYVLGGLPMGSYSVGFEGCGRDRKFRNPVPECYADAPRLPSGRRGNSCDVAATPVTVQAGEQRTGIDAQLAFIDNPAVDARQNRNRFKVQIPITLSADEPVKALVAGGLTTKFHGGRREVYPFKPITTTLAAGRQKRVMMRLKSKRKCEAILKRLTVKKGHNYVYARGTVTFTDGSAATTSPTWRVSPKPLDRESDRKKLRAGKGSC
jgi:hypothetical protein